MSSLKQQQQQLKVNNQHPKITNVYKVIHFPHWTHITCALPLFGFIICVLIAVVYHFEKATKTHCRVWNILPSISAAVGDSTPERYIWRFSIAFHCIPRLVLISMVYWNQYAKWAVTVKNSLFNMLYKITVILHVLENVCLVSLTFVSSTENYKIHEASFISFMVFATFHMVFTLYIQNKARKIVGFTQAVR